MNKQVAQMALLQEAVTAFDAGCAAIKGESLKFA
jgi:hypothetical protein